MAHHLVLMSISRVSVGYRDGSQAQMGQPQFPEPLRGLSCYSNYKVPNF